MSRQQPCHDYHELISQYIDGDLSGDERAVLLDHLKTCEECRRTLESYRAIGTRLRAMRPVQPPETLTGDIFAVTINAGPKRLYMLTSRVGYSLAAVAAVILIFVVAVYLIIGGYQRRIDPEVVASQPGENVNGWPLQLPIRITFNKEMDRESVEAALTIQPPSEHEWLLETVSWDGNTLILGGNQLLKPNTEYSVSIGSAAQDKWGNQLDDDFELAFTAGPTTALETPVPAAPTPTATPEPAPTATNTPVADSSDIPPPPTTPPNIVPPTATPEPPPPATSTQTTGAGPGDGPSQPAAPTATATPTEPPATPTEPEVAQEATATPTPPPTATSLPPTPTSLPPTETPTLAPVESTATSTPDTIPVSGAFGGVYWGNQAVQDRLGLPLQRVYTSGAHELDFQRGSMFLRVDTNQILVLERAGVWSAWTNTSTNPPEVMPGPEPGLWTPGGELGELWTNEPLIQELLGYALEEAYHPFESRVQVFEFGTMLLSHTGQVYVIYDDGAWEFYTDPGSTE